MTKPTSQIRVRMAPSPTGNLHVGTAHTTIFNYLFARHNQGKFILRIEDTDKERSTKEFEKNILDGLNWLGVEWEEGSMSDGSEKGEYGPYHQSKRINIYKKYLELLLTEGRAFACFCSKNEDSTIVVEDFTNRPDMHDCPYRNNIYDPNDSKNFVIRYKNDKFQNYYSERRTFIQSQPGTASIFSYSGKDNKDNYVFFNDIIRGVVGSPQWFLTDFVIAKNLNEPLYNFVVVVDDYEMKISHIIRGEDHIPNTPKQLLIAEALGWAKKDSNGVFCYPSTPWKYAHLPLLLGSDRSKLSKRHGATSISQYKDEGYLPEAMFNYLALLGWNPGTEQEIFSLDDLVSAFSLEKVQKAGAIFDITKLDWMNGEYIRKKSLAELRELAEPYLRKFSFDNNEYIEQILALEQSRLKKLSELPDKIDYFFKEPEYDKELLVWKSMSGEDLKKSLFHSQQIIEKIAEENWNKEFIENIFLKECGNYQNRGELLWPMRVALSGKKASPGPFDILAVLGKTRSSIRIQKAISML